MSGIDFFTYVVSSTRISLNLIMILIASAILVGAVVVGVSLAASHMHFGVSTRITNAGLTVGLTSAGTVAVAAVAKAWISKRKRGAKDKDGS